MWWNGKFWGELKQKQANFNTNVFISGLRGSSFAFLLNDVFQNTSSNFFIVCNDKEKAAYLLNDLQALLPEKHIHIQHMKKKSKKKIENQKYEEIKDMYKRRI